MFEAQLNGFTVRLNRMISRVTGWTPFVEQIEPVHDE